jgi:hypothetical protein
MFILTGEKVEISCISLKEVFAGNKIDKCDLMKMDCEGAEYEILYNAPKNILQKIKKISMEFHNIDDLKNNDKELISFLRKSGFKVKLLYKRKDDLFKEVGIIYAKRG